MKKIIIIGGGWYGCYAALLLQQIYDITIIEQDNDIFNGSSFYNQNRLHIGFHYCRNYNTRELCKNGYISFLNKFAKHNIVQKLINNYYLISTKSLLDFETINSIFIHEKYDFNTIHNVDFFQNIDSNILLVDECVINSKKSKDFFKKNLNCKFIFNKKVININCSGNACEIILNDNSTIIADLVVDCTYNQLNLSSKKYVYEKTISLLYKKILPTTFDAITIIDGDFCSLYPHEYDDNIYTLTDVEFTPLLKSININDMINYQLSEDKLNDTISKMSEKIKYYYPEFDKYFKYDGYFLSNKTKLLSKSDSRECNIENIGNKLLTINCGKITGIFVMEDYFKEINLI